MSEVTKPIALDESLNTTEQTPRNLADVLADELVISDLVTQATAIVTKLQALINAVKPNASDIPLDPITGMSATNVQSGISELKGTLDDYNTHNIVEQVAYDSTSTATWYEATITPNTVTGYTVCGVAGYKCNKSDVYPFAFYFNGSTLRIGLRRINGDLSDVKFTVYFEYYKS